MTSIDRLAGTMNNFYLFFFILLISGCARPEKIATQTETDLEIRQKILSEPEQETREQKRVRAFNVATFEMKQASFSAALKSWEQYLSEYTGLPQFEEAQMYHAKCLFYLSKIDETINELKPLLETPKNEEIFVEGRLLYAEALLLKKRSDEAVAVTFDLLPEKKLEKKLGIVRKPHFFKISKFQELKILTLRGRIFADMNREVEAIRSLRDARRILKTVHEDKAKFTSIVAWRQIDTLSALCQNRIVPPKKLSEGEFLDFVQEYYHCIEPGSVFFCEVLGFEDSFIRATALKSYKEMVLYPKKLQNPLPPPSRLVKPEFKLTYENEMKELIEKTVSEKSKPFRNLEKCNAFELF